MTQEVAPSVFSALPPLPLLTLSSLSPTPAGENTGRSVSSVRGRPVAGVEDLAEEGAGHREASGSSCARRDSRNGR